MAKVDVFLNFDGNTEEAFKFYQSVFGGEFDGDLMRYSDMPAEVGSPELPEDVKNMIMHIALPLTEHTTLRGTDAVDAVGQHVKMGNNAYVHFQPNTIEEAERIFTALSDGGTVEMPLEEQFWGDLFGSFADKFGVHWMVSCPVKER